MATARVRSVDDLPLAGQLDGTEILIASQQGAAVAITAQKLASKAAGLIPPQAPATKQSVGLGNVENLSPSQLADPSSPIGAAISGRAPGNILSGATQTAPNSAIPFSPYLNLIEKIQFSQYCPGDANRDSGPDIDRMLARANAAPRGARIVVPDFIYYTSLTHTITGRVNFEGPGGSTGRIIQTTSNRDLFVVAADTAVEFSGLCLQQQNTNQTAGRLITIGGANTQNQDTQIKYCTLLNGWMQLDTQNAAKLHVLETKFVSFIYGARVQNLYNGDQGDFSFSNCNFGTENAIGESAILMHSAGGLRVLNSKLIGGKTGLKMQLKDIAAIPSNATTILVVDGGSIEGHTVANIELTHDASTTSAHFSMVDITPGELAIFSSGGKNVWVHGSYVFLDSLNLRPGAMQCPPGAIGFDIDVVKCVRTAPGVVTGGYTGAGVNQPIGDIEILRGNVLFNKRIPCITPTSSYASRVINQSDYAEADDEIRVYHPGATTTNTLDLICYVALIDKDNSACRVEIVTDGNIPTVGPVFAASSFIVTRGVGNASIAVTAATAAQPSVGGVTHVTGLQTSNGRVVFYAQFSAPNTQSNLSHRVRVSGRYCRIQQA